jgi:23S rRNA (adenine2503-C2)-methyltransferase
MRCKFCSVPTVGPGRNASVEDLLDQVRLAVGLHPEVIETNRLNIHYARMGEPTFNPAVLEATYRLKLFQNSGSVFGCKAKIHPVVSTMLPKGNHLLPGFLTRWMEIKNDLLEGEAGLQLSINSTNDREREEMFGGCALTLSEIGDLVRRLPSPKGRKITLNFAVAGWEIDPKKLLTYFDPKDYLVKLTPMHKTREALQNGIQTEGDYTTFEPYKAYERALLAAGYDVLVFIASVEEDLGRITCGNAILAGTHPEVPYKEWP